MKRTLMATSAALALAAATFTFTAADAQGNRSGVEGSRGGGGAAAARGGGGGAAILRGGNRGGGGGAAILRGGNRGGGGGAAILRGGGGGGGAAILRGNGAQRFSGSGQWRGQHDGRRHFRRAPAYAYGLGAPYFYDNGYDSGYGDDGCFQWQQVQTNDGLRWARVNVCE